MGIVSNAGAGSSLKGHCVGGDGREWDGMGAMNEALSYRPCGEGKEMVLLRGRSSSQDLNGQR